MNYLDKMKSFVANLFRSPNQTEQHAEFGLMDVYLEKIVGILSWKSKEQTLKIFFWFNTLFWITLMLNLRLYGTLSIIALHIFVYDMWWRETLYSEFKGEYLEIIGNIKNVFFKLNEILKVLRRESPLMFASSMVLVFLTLRMVSSSISGHILSYLLFITMFFLPVCFKMLPEHVAVKIRTFISSISAPKCVLAEDELIPFIQGKDFGKRDADLESLLTDRTADSVTNSFISGISAMPSYLEVAETPCDIEEEDLLPRAGSQGVSFTPGELSSDSDSDHREIRFDSDHFNTSSSEEDPYSKNLSFPKDIKETAPREKDSAGIRNMISNVFSSVRRLLLPQIFFVSKSKVLKAESAL